MTEIVIAFVLPILVIILTIALESILHCPYKVTAIIFVILILTAIVLALLFENTLFLILLAWLYTLVAFITAFIANRFFCNCRCRNLCGCTRNDNNGNSNNDENNGNSNIGDFNNGNGGNNGCGCRRR